MKQHIAVVVGVSMTLLVGSVVAAGADTGWYAGAVTDLERSEFRFREQPDGALSASNRSHDLRTSISTDGMRVRPRTADADATAFELHLRLAAFGRVGAAHPVVGPKSLRFDGPRAELDHDGLVEWWINDARGVEHGFDVPAPPPGATGEVVLVLDLGGSLQALPLGEDGVLLRGPGGKETLRYDGLYVEDAGGMELPARLEIGRGELRIVYDDTSAAYPVRVDPVLTSPTWGLTGGLFSGLGGGVSTAGDVNGDGYSDILIGTPRFDGGQDDEGLVALYLGSASGPTAPAAWTFQSDQFGAELGASVATGGDLNGDGYDDVIVGSPRGFNGQTREGLAYVFLGSASGLSATPHRTLEVDQAFAGFGTSVDFAGDLNNDGFHDVVVGAPEFNAGASGGGSIFVWFGSSSGLSQTHDWSQGSLHAGANFGTSVAGAGDVDGDGFGDIVAGAPNYDFPDVDEGRVFLYTGSSTTPSFAGAYVQTGSFDAGAGLGTSVAGVGDLNGDGYADVVAGAPDYAVGTPTGRVIVIYGGSSGFSSTTYVLGGTNNSRRGAAVSTAGDVNGDGLADFIVGEPGADRVQLYCGVRSVIVLPCGTIQFASPGSSYGAAVGTAGDVDDDGYSDVLVGAPDFSINGFLYGYAALYRGTPDGIETSGDLRVGAFDGRKGATIAYAGDVNGDGFDDVAVAEPEYDTGVVDAGRVYVYHGSRDGLELAPAWTHEGVVAFERFGDALASAGDVNGDGYDDLIVGSPGFSSSQPDQGRAYVAYGGPSGLGVPATFIAVNDADARLGAAVASAGDIDNDGYGDVVVGVPGLDRAYVYRGGPGSLDLGSAVILDGDPGSEFGSAAAGADLDGDGFGDLVIGAANHGGTGAIHGFRGSSAGIATAATWFASGSSAGERFGERVACAGDVDGDAHDDVVVGSPDYTNGQAVEGRVSILAGVATGTLPVMVQRESNLPGAFLGRGVAAAGDVNGDGFADVFAGASGSVSINWNQPGYVDVWYGAPSGPTAAPSLTLAGGTQGSERFGTSVAAAGDVDGDGDDDLIVGAPGNSIGDDGAFMIFRGGDGIGMDRIPRQQQPYGVGDPPVALRGRSADNDSVRIRSRARTAAGRDRVQVVYEIKPLGVPFDGTGFSYSSELKTSAPLSDGSRTNFSSRVYGLTAGPGYHWRLRMRSPNPKFPHTRWLWASAISPTQRGFSTNCTLTTWLRDADGDGFGDDATTLESCSTPSGYVATGGDCDDSDGNAWNLPGEVTGLTLEPVVDGTRLVWSPPANPGGTVDYAVVRADTGDGFATDPSCVVTTSQTIGEDETVPAAGATFYYLVVAENGCGRGTAGADSGGAERPLAACP